MRPIYVLLLFVHFVKSAKKFFCSCHRGEPVYLQNHFNVPWVLPAHCPGCSGYQWFPRVFTLSGETARLLGRVNR